jgi:16S rRNA (guanine527-N7)-methyltransferase
MTGLSSEERSLIVRHAAVLGVAVSATQLEALGGYVDLVVAWNHRRRLVGSRSRADIIARHILDCLAPARILGAGLDVADIGTGAGLPGIVLAIAVSGARFTLIDSRRLAANLVRDAARSLGLANVTVLEAAVEDLGDTTERSFDATIARAWSDLRSMLLVSERLLRPGGRAIAMKGPRVYEELRDLGDAHRSAFEDPILAEYNLPGRRRRAMLVFHRC